MANVPSYALNDSRATGALGLKRLNVHYKPQRSEASEPSAIQPYQDASGRMIGSSGTDVYDVIYSLTPWNPLLFPSARIDMHKFMEAHGAGLAHFQ